MNHWICYPKRIGAGGDTDSKELNRRRENLFYIEDKEDEFGIGSMEMREVLLHLRSEDMLKERVKFHDALMKVGPNDALKSLFSLTYLSDFAVQCRLRMIRDSLTTIFEKFNLIKVIPIGSIATRSAFRDDAIDLLIETYDTDFNSDYDMYRNFYGYENMLALTLLEHIENVLLTSKDFREVTYIDTVCGSKVSCVHVSTGFSINFHTFRPSSADMTILYKMLTKSDSRIHELYCFLKLWCKQLQLFVKSNLTSQTLFIMVLFYLQQPLGIFKSKPPLPPIRLVQFSAMNYDKRLSKRININKIIPKPKIPIWLTVCDLIIGFFDFYDNFNYDTTIISAYMGLQARRNDFNEGKFFLIEYVCNMHYIYHMLGYLPRTLCTEGDVCIQDTIYLHANIGDNIRQSYLWECINVAHRFCEKNQNLPLITIYENLLFGYIKPKLGVNIGKHYYDTSDNITISLDVRQTDFNYLKSICDPHCIKRSKLLNLSKIWINCYVHAFEIIISRIFALKVEPDWEKLHETQRIYGENIRKIWKIGAMSDFPRNFCRATLSNAFLNQQFKYIRSIYEKHYIKKNFVDDVEGQIILNVEPDYKSLNLMLYGTDFANALELRSSHPLRITFYLLKLSLYKLTIQHTVETFKATLTNAMPRSLCMAYLKKATLRKKLALSEPNLPEKKEKITEKKRKPEKISKTRQKNFKKFLQKF